MDDFSKRLLQRLVRRIPAQTLRATLEKWGRLTAAQRQSIDFTQPKWELMEKLLAIFEVCGAVSLQRLSLCVKTKYKVSKLAFCNVFYRGVLFMKLYRLCLTLTLAKMCVCARVLTLLLHFQESKWTVKHVTELEMLCRLHTFCFNMTTILSRINLTYLTRLVSCFKLYFLDNHDRPCFSLASRLKQGTRFEQTVLDTR